MPFAKQALQQDLEYTAWANALALEACAALTPEELARDLGLSHRNIIGTLFHFYDGECFWFECLNRNAIPPLDAFGETEQPTTTPEQTLATLQQTWPTLWHNFLKWFATLPAEELTAQISSKLSTGIDLDFPRWQILRHMVNHSTLHRGQIIGMLRMLGKQPPQTDLMSYYGYLLRPRTAS